jgi:PKHD-type hydroxylase
MILTLPSVVTPEQAERYRQALVQAHWVDGRETAGHLAAQAKKNLQLALDDPLARELGEPVLAALANRPTFVAATLPARIVPPRFNRYEAGGTYGNHVDNAIFAIPAAAQRVRSDISATLFLSAPEDYEGGELIIEDTFGTQRIKLPAGHMVIYPSSSVHRVSPVTRGVRLASFFWIQSLVREDHRRRLLWELDRSIQAVSSTTATHDTIASLTGVYHNLIREWSSP